MEMDLVKLVLDMLLALNKDKSLNLYLQIYY